MINHMCVFYLKNLTIITIFKIMLDCFKEQIEQEPELDELSKARKETKKAKSKENRTF